MVYLRAVTSALCEVLDTAAAASPTPAAAVRSYIEDRLRSLVHTQTPSQLDNALWIYLTTQQQLLSRQSKEKEGEEEGAQTALPPSLQLPPAITSVQDAVMWYCGEICVDAPNAEDAAAAAAEKGVSSSSPTPQARPSIFRRSAPLRERDAKHANAGGRLDELLRHRHQPASAAVTAMSAEKSENTSRTAAAGTEAKPSPPPPASTGPLATLRLALEALGHPKRAAALRQPRSLALVVRSLVALWSVVYLCRQLRQHQLRKERVLKGGDMTETAAASALAVCFHDYDTLLPWDVVLSVLPGTSMAAVAARCREVEAQRKGVRRFHTTTSSGIDSDSLVSLVINPAVTVLDDNPDRLRKNARVDAIDEAANKYYYTLLATGAHGQAEAALRATAGGAASPSATGAAAAASAAAHQEAVRSSLATVDLGDYGVLDPSRMRAPVPLSTTPGSVSGNGGCASAERNAKSYALFLRDASIGFDIQIMALTGAGVGYYIGYLRSLSTEWCTLYAVVGLATMMLVDAVLIMIRMGRQDAAALRSRKRIRRQREKLEREGERLVQAMRHATSSDTPADASETAETNAAAAVKYGAGSDVDARTKKQQ